MTNFEYWKDEILKIVNTGVGIAINKNTNKPVACGRGPIKCSDCICNTSHCCVDERFAWLYAEHVERSTLTREERMFCELVKTGYIARDEDGKIFYFKHMPIGYNGAVHGHYWSAAVQDMTVEMHVIDCLQEGFEFIKGTDEKPWNVEELLKLEVREEKDN